MTEAPTGEPSGPSSCGCLGVGRVFDLIEASAHSTSELASTEVNRRTCLAGTAVSNSTGSSGLSRPCDVGTRSLIHHGRSTHTSLLHTYAWHPRSRTSENHTPHKESNFRAAVHFGRGPFACDDTTAGMLGSTKDDRCRSSSRPGEMNPEGVRAPLLFAERAQVERDHLGVVEQLTPGAGV